MRVDACGVGEHVSSKQACGIAKRLITHDTQQTLSTRLSTAELGLKHSEGGQAGEREREHQLRQMVSNAKVQGRNLEMAAPSGATTDMYKGPCRDASSRHHESTR